MPTGVEQPAGTLQIALLGSPQVHWHGAPLPRLRSRKGLWLLALLALRHGRPVERSWLAATLWPDSPETLSFANMRRALTDLRRALGPEAARLRSPSPHTLRLDLSGAEVDVVDFDTTIARGDLPSLERAVALYQGPLLAGCTEEWVFEEREKRAQAYLGALEALAAGAIARNDPGRAEPLLRQAVAADPLRESAQRALLRVLAAQGAYAAALRVYRELRLCLHRELNAEPDPETAALFQQIRIEARGRARVPALPLPSTAAAVVEGSGRTARQAGHRSPSSMPGGTKTFLFTDVESSTRLWEESPDAMRAALHRHDCLLRDALEAHGGYVFKTMGDQFCAAFPSAPQALAAALAAQRALSGSRGSGVGCRVMDDDSSSLDPTPDPLLPLRVRMALHTGAVEERGGDYFGPPLNRIARLLEAGHGGQILLSRVTQELVREQLPEGASVRDLGEHRLRDLTQAERIFQLLAPDLPTDFPPLRTLEARRQNLPHPPAAGTRRTPLLGREREVASVRDLIRCREVGLVTLTGAGGAGKTRLALEVAADLLDSFGEGIFFVDLGPISDPALVVSAIARALGVRESGGRPLMDDLEEHLRDKQILLLLDNFEHLLTAASAIADLLAAAPQLKVLATSREALRLPGEQEFLVSPLPVPGEDVGCRVKGVGSDEKAPADPYTLHPTPYALLQFPSVQLFIDRARAVKLGFALTAKNAPAVAEVCRRLDGLPLAIELAAACVKVLPVEQIAARLNDRFRLPARGSRTALPHQQTLRTCMDWSYNLLTGAEQLLLRRLSVFAGGCTLEAAEAVCSDFKPQIDTDEHGSGELAGGRSLIIPGHLCSSVSIGGSKIQNEDVLDLLTRLVEKSLVIAEEWDGRGRYRLLEIIRQYAHDRLEETEADAVRRRHRDFFLSWAERAASRLRGAEQLGWIARIDREHDNLRAALRECLATEVESGERGVERAKKSAFAGLSTPNFPLSTGTGSREAGLRLATALSGFWLMRNHFREGRQWLEEALSTRDEVPPSLRAKALAGAAHLAGFDGDGATARQHAEMAVRLGREIGEPWAAAWALFYLGIDAMEGRDFNRAAALAEESLASAQAAADPWLTAQSLLLLGMIVRTQGHFDTAAAFLTKSLSLLRQVGDRWSLSIVLHNQAVVAMAQGDDAQAAALSREAVLLCREMSDRRGIAWCLHGLAWAAVGQGEGQRAMQLWGAAEALGEDARRTLPPIMRQTSERCQRDVRARLGEESSAAAWAAGRAMTMEQAIRCALEPLRPPTDEGVKG